MNTTQGVSVALVVIGVLLLILTVISVLCGTVAMVTMNKPVAVSVGLWGLYFLIPGVISVLAGKKLKGLLAVALGTHIVGSILGIIGAIIAAAWWRIRAASTCAPYSFEHRSSTTFGHCTCTYGLTVYKYPARCSELETVRGITAAVTIIFCLATIISFIGSTYGCIGTFCAPAEPTVIVTTPQQPNTVLMTTQEQSAYNMQPQPAYYLQPQPAYNQQPQPAYNQQPQPAYNQQPQPAYNQQPQPAYNQQPQPAYNYQPQPAYNQPPPPYSQSQVIMDTRL